MVMYQFRKRRGKRLPTIVRYVRKANALGVMNLGHRSKPLAGSHPGIPTSRVTLLCHATTVQVKKTFPSLKRGGYAQQATAFKPLRTP